MYIKEIHITAFGPITDADITVSRGLNIIEGANESGKSTVASFIKFVFYGLSARGGDSVPDKLKYINWARGVAAGHLVIVTDEAEFRIERTLSAREGESGKVKFSESVKLLDNETNMPVKISVSPGEYFFGVGEQVFTNSSFVSQAAELRPDSGAVRESLENMISAADENISVKRAADTLEKARIKLLHKNRGGGEIYELERRIEYLEDTLNESKEKSARLIRSEVSLADVKEKLDASKKRSLELEETYAALSVIDAAAKLDRAEETRATLEKAKANLAAETGKGADEKFVSELAVAVRDIDRYGKMKAEYAKKCDSEENTEERPGADEVFEVRRLLGKSKGYFAIAMAVLTAALLGFAVSAILTVIPLLAGTAVLIIIGIVFLCLFFSSKRNAYDILDYWDVEDEDELEEMIGSSEENREMADRAAALDSAEKAALEAAKTLSSMASSVGITDNSKIMTPTELVKALGKYAAESAAKRKALEAECSRLEGQLTESEGAASGLNADEVRAKLASLRETEAGRHACDMTPEMRNAAERERTFNAQKADMLREREIELERECAALRAECPAPADTAEKLSSMKTKLSAMKRAHSSYVLALETLSSASEGVRSSVVPRLVEEASELLSRVTDGRYRRLGMSSGFDMSFRTEDFGTREIDYMSTGTRDAAYLALRLSLVKALFEENKRPPVIFDESFAYFDEERVKAALEMLSDYDAQTFLFTCRSLEGQTVKNGSVTRLPTPKRI